MQPKPTGKYPKEWLRIAELTKQAAGWKCVRCGHAHDPAAGYTLTVHHLDHNKSHCQWFNLAPLCQRCHLHIQAKVVMPRIWYLDHSEWFKPFAAGYYADLYKLYLDETLIRMHADELIAVGQGTLKLEDLHFEHYKEREAIWMINAHRLIDAERLVACTDEDLAAWMAELGYEWYPTMHTLGGWDTATPKPEVEAI